MQNMIGAEQEDALASAPSRFLFARSPEESVQIIVCSIASATWETPIT
ncbi:hypothetical protein GARCT_00105 [Geobacillus sp. 12AMOR1]|nr:hypothetical protein GARCT_00105 [Geobacillus sp. 12AMOR1]